MELTITIVLIFIIVHFFPGVQLLRNSFISFTETNPSNNYLRKVRYFITAIYILLFYLDKDFIKDIAHLNEILPKHYLSIGASCLLAIALNFIWTKRFGLLIYYIKNNSKKTTSAHQATEEAISEQVTERGFNIIDHELELKGNCQNGLVVDSNQKKEQNTYFIPKDEFSIQRAATILNYFSREFKGFNIKTNEFLELFDSSSDSIIYLTSTKHNVEVQGRELPYRRDAIFHVFFKVLKSNCLKEGTTQVVLTQRIKFNNKFYARKSISRIQSNLIDITDRRIIKKIKIELKRLNINTSILDNMID